MLVTLRLGLMAVAHSSRLSYDDAVSPLTNPVGEFGNKFRKEREKKGISLDDVSNVTKIGSRMLQAIEEEHFDLLPGGVFNKGFIRAYAKHLGLNDEEAVNEYLACLRQAQIDAQAVWEPARPADLRPAAPEKRPLGASNRPSVNRAGVKTQTPAQVEELPELQLPRAEHVRPPRNHYADRRDSGIPWKILVVASVALILGIVLWSRHSRSTRTETAPGTPPATPVAVNQSAAPSAASLPATANHAPHPAGKTESMARLSAPNAHPATASHPPAAASLQPPVNAAENDVKAPSAEPAMPPSAPPATPLTLVIRASENSWISVTADGQTVSRETLIAPVDTSVRAHREIVVRAGNAAGVSFLWNGKEIPAQGAEAEVKTFVFDATGMRVLPPPQPPAPNQ